MEPGCARQSIVDYLSALKQVLDNLPIDGVDMLIQHLRDAYEDGQQVFVIGNGGSAATASHMACDLGKTVLGNQVGRPAKRFRIIALTDNVPLITAWGNDECYETVFAEQLRNLANHGDMLIVITASGNSPDIINAVTVARESKMKVVGLLGFDGGVAKPLMDHSVIVESTNYGHIEDAHMVLVHLLTAYFKQLLHAEHLTPDVRQVG